MKKRKYYYKNHKEEKNAFTVLYCVYHCQVYICFKDEPYVQNYIYIALYIIQDTTDIILLTNTRLQK